MARLVFAGDIMLADGPGGVIERGVDPFAAFGATLADADLTIGNLECVIARGGAPVKKPWTFRADPRTLPVLARHFDVVSLANNHTGDFGRDAFTEMLGLLERQPLPYFGGGAHCAAARTPRAFNVNGLRLALLGYNDFKPRSFEAGPTWPGSAWAVDEQVLADIREVRNHADVVIPFMHWGWESEPENDRQTALARAMIDAGADAVVGAHPHVTQGIEHHRGRLIVYSLGNFVFDGFAPGPERVGWLLRLRIDKAGVVAWDTVAARLDADGVPHRMPEAVTPSGRRGDTNITRRGENEPSPFDAPTPAAASR